MTGNIRFNVTKQRKKMTSKFYHLTTNKYLELQLLFCADCTYLLLTKIKLCVQYPREKET